MSESGSFRSCGAGSGNWPGPFEKEKTEKMAYITSLQAKLDNKNFIERAKPEIVKVEQIKLDAAQEELVKIEHHLASLL